MTIFKILQLLLKTKVGPCVFWYFGILLWSRGEKTCWIDHWIRHCLLVITKYLSHRLETQYSLFWWSQGREVLEVTSTKVYTDFSQFGTPLNWIKSLQSVLVCWFLTNTLSFQRYFCICRVMLCVCVRVCEWGDARFLVWEFALRVIFLKKFYLWSSIYLKHLIVKHILSFFGDIWRQTELDSMGPFFFFSFFLWLFVRGGGL